MKLLVMVLNKEEFLDDILSIMAELEIEGATIVDSEGMAHALAYEVPIFAGLQKIVGEKKSCNKTIFALLKDENTLDKLNKIFKEEGIHFEDEETGIMFTVPVDDVIK